MAPLRSPHPRQRLVKTATITGTLATVKQTAVLTYTPPPLLSVSVAPSTVTGVTAAKGTVTIGGPAPAGYIVKLKSSTKSAVPPVSVVVPVGKTTATFNIRTVAVPSQVTATITATQSTISVTTTLTIVPPTLVLLKVSPASIKHGASATGTVTISGPAPTGGLVISLSELPGGAAIPNTVKVAAGAKTATFLIKATKNTSAGQITFHSNADRHIRDCNADDSVMDSK